jgi:hypothetical protein
MRFDGHLNPSELAGSVSDDAAAIVLARRRMASAPTNVPTAAPA